MIEKVEALANGVINFLYGPNRPWFRDYSPDGGTLEISVSNESVPMGLEYVCLSRNRPQMFFEPFNIGAWKLIEILPQ